MTQLDSIFTSDVTTVISDSVAIEETIPQTPIQVLRLLPKDTAPVELPQYYREGNFVGDTLYYQEVESGNYGIPGTPLAYMAVHDSLISSILFGCLLFFCFVFSHFWDFIAQQAKAIFYSRKEQFKSTSNELQLMLGLLTTSSIVCSILYYLYVMAFVSETHILSSDYLLLAVFFGVIVAYHALHFLLYHIVNITFFDKRTNRKFLTSNLFLSGMVGILLLPGIFLLAHYGFTALSMVIYAGFVLFLVKILSFYKSYNIFFKRNVFFLQIILYFCALEIIPLVMLIGGLSAIVDILKVN